MIGLRPCLEPGCPRLSRRSRCDFHRREHDAARNHHGVSAAERGYDADHRAERASWAPDVATGTVHCARCGGLIAPTQSWDLGHTDDRSGWTGPEHRRCNRAAALARANGRAA